MVTFYPNLDPDKITDDVFAFGFWTYIPANENIDPEGAFAPSGTTFSPVISFNNQIVGFPNSDIRRMSKKQFIELKKNIMRQIITTMWDNASRSEEPTDQINGQNIFRYTFLNIIIPLIFTQAYDVSAQPGFVAEAKKQLIDDLYDFVQTYIDDPFFQFFNPTNKLFCSSVVSLLPTYVPAIEVGFNPKNLQLTLCRYYDNMDFFDCNPCLFFEKQYLLSVNNFSSKIKNLKLLKYKDYINIRLTDEIIRRPKPDCDLCKRYVVYCSSYAKLDMEGMNIFEIPVPLTKENSLVLELVDRDRPEGIYPSSAKFFNTYEDAFNYRQSIIEENKTKWVCLTKSGAGMGMGGMGGTEDTIEKECVEVYEICADSFVAEDSGIIKYNTLAECEQNCGKKWYCLEYQCTLVDENSQLVQNMEGYDTQEQCEQHCVIPTGEPPTETPS